MPIYLYRCQQCNLEIEKLQKVSDPQLTDCPTCAAATLKKVLAPVGIIFKGTGFHKNDYSGSGSKSSGSSSASSSSSDSSSSDSSSGTATATPAKAAETSSSGDSSSSPAAPSSSGTEKA